jgi:hypothetical protein
MWDGGGSSALADIDLIHHIDNQKCITWNRRRRGGGRTSAATRRIRTAALPQQGGNLARETKQTEIWTASQSGTMANPSMDLSPARLVRARARSCAVTEAHVRRYLPAALLGSLFGGRVHQFCFFTRANVRPSASSFARSLAGAGGRWAGLLRGAPSLTHCGGRPPFLWRTVAAPVGLAYPAVHLPHSYPTGR